MKQVQLNYEQTPNDVIVLCKKEYGNHRLYPENTNAQIMQRIAATEKCLTNEHCDVLDSSYWLFNVYVYVDKDEHGNITGNTGAKVPQNLVCWSDYKEAFANNFRPSSKKVSEYESVR